MTVTETVEVSETEVPGTEVATTLLSKEGPVSLNVLLKALRAPERAPEHEGPIPLPAVITEAQREALGRLMEVFGQVVPATRRELATPEITALIKERMVLDEIANMVTARKEGLRTTVFNHLDVGVDADEVQVDDKGHFVVAGEARGDGVPKRFTREVRTSAPELSVDRLQVMADDPECDLLTRQDFFAMTEQRRVVSEPRVMLALQRNPKLLRAIAEATDPGRSTGSLYMRKA
jgi:hypothetical protein